MKMNNETETIITTQNVLKGRIEELIDAGYVLANNLEDTLISEGKPSGEGRENYYNFLKVFRSIFKRTYSFFELPPEMEETDKRRVVVTLLQLFDANVQPKADFLLRAFYAYMELLKGVGLYPKIIITEDRAWD